MEVWQTILLALGGNAAMLAVLGCLSKSLLERVLVRDSRRLEYELKSKADKEIENFKSELATAATEHQIRFSRLHERRAEVIAESYGLLSSLHAGLADYVKIFEPAGGPSKEDRRKVVVDAHNAFIGYYSKNKIFLSKAAVEMLDNINQDSRRSFYEFLYEVEVPQVTGGISYIEKWNKVFTEVSKAMPEALEELEGEFRRLLGDES